LLPSKLRQPANDEGADAERKLMNNTYFAEKRLNGLAGQDEIPLRWISNCLSSRANWNAFYLPETSRVLPHNLLYVIGEIGVWRDGDASCVSLRFRQNSKTCPSRHVGVLILRSVHDPNASHRSYQVGPAKGYFLRQIFGTPEYETVGPSV
jgi:hypothetical protein